MIVSIILIAEVSLMKTVKLFQNDQTQDNNTSKPLFSSLFKFSKDFMRNRDQSTHQDREDVNKHDRN